MQARKSAIAAGLPIIPGTDYEVNSPEEAYNFCQEHGVPVIFKVMANKTTPTTYGRITGCLSSLQDNAEDIYHGTI